MHLKKKQYIKRNPSEKSWRIKFCYFIPIIAINIKAKEKKNLPLVSVTFIMGPICA
jgi:hypothetical protein